MENSKAARAVAQRIIDNVKRVIVGKDEAVELGIVALICQGHALIEDVPGVGKTMLAKSIARSAGCTFKRFQFTPDMLPSDITGSSIYNQKTGDFEFRPGPVVAQIVLADEINRATPKTQSALLEAMEERQITVEGITRPLPQPFIVLATQNPIEYEGTFPLPEAQLDRFLLRIQLGYPSFEDEIEIIDRQQFVHPMDSLEEVATPDDILSIQEHTRSVYLDDLIKHYIVNLVAETRNHPDIGLGASPRAALALVRSTQTLAFLRDRDYVIPDDVKELATAVLAHRIIVAPGARMRGLDDDHVIADVLERVTVPGVRARGS